MCNVSLKKFRTCCFGCGFHVYENVWAPQLNEKLDVHHEEGNLFNIFAVKTCPRTYNEIVKHWQHKISQPTKYQLDRGAVITVILKSDRYRRSPLYWGGLEIPLLQILKWIHAYFELVSKRYCKLEDVSVGNFVVPGNNVNLQQSRWKVNYQKVWTFCVTKRQMIRLK